MADSIGEDFKLNFAVSLQIIELTWHGATGAVKYSNSLYRGVLAGLEAQGKIEIGHKEVDTIKAITKPSIEIKDLVGHNLKQRLELADLYFMKSLQLRQVTSHEAWWKSQTTLLCKLHDQIMYPIALSEGLLSSKDVALMAIQGLGGAGISPLGGDDD